MTCTNRDVLCGQVPSFCLNTVWCDHVLSCPRQSLLRKRVHDVYMHNNSGNENRRISRGELRESHATIQELTSQVQELQERMNCMSDSQDFQDFESTCSGNVSHVHSQPAVVPSLRAVSSRDQSLRPVTWNLPETQGNFFGHPRAVIDSSQTPHQEILHSWNQSATSGNPVRDSTRRPVAKIEEQFRGTIPLPTFGRRPSTMN